MRVCISAVLLLFMAAGFASSDPPAKKLTPEEARKKFFGYWLEAEQIAKGKSFKDPNHLSGFQFASDGWYVWGRRGELSAGQAAYKVHFDPTTTPMRVDFDTGTRKVPDNGQRRLKLAICKFDGDKLHITFSPWMWVDPPAKGEDYKGRPMSFDEGYSVLVPSVLYGTD